MPNRYMRIVTCGECSTTDGGIFEGRILFPEDDGIHNSPEESLNGRVKY